jgi:protein-disulfide isomerase
VVSLVEYGDFECPYCRAAVDIVNELQKALGDQLSFAFRHFPMRDVHPHAQHAAEVSERRHGATSGNCTIVYLQLRMAWTTSRSFDMWEKWTSMPTLWLTNWTVTRSRMKSKTTCTVGSRAA